MRMSRGLMAAAMMAGAAFATASAGDLRAPVSPPTGGRKKGKGSARTVTHHMHRSRGGYIPHQGKREIARRRRQIDAGQLTPFVTGYRDRPLQEAA